MRRASEGGSGRCDLARRIVDPAVNPLVPRVLVNRLWQHHFGEGIVRSIDDFGAMGQKPSHPALLDWLACKLVESGWSIKAIHRLMLTSNTYRMSSLPDARAEQVDPGNALLHRMNVRRLEAESIRDAILAVSGQLKPAMYGPSVAVHLTSYMEGRGRPESIRAVGRQRAPEHLSECQAQFSQPDVSCFRCARAVFDDGPAKRVERPRAGVNPHE